MEGKRKVEKIIQCWDEKNTRSFADKTGKISLTEGNLQEKWEELRVKVEETVVKKRIKWRKKMGYKKWWDRKCTRKKRKAERNLKRWTFFDFYL